MSCLRVLAGILFSAVFVLSAVAPGGAQTPARPSSVDLAMAQAFTTLKVTVVLSRFNGEKKIANLPFVLMIVPGDERPTTVQMSAQVPIPQTTFNADTKAASTSYTYQSIGTNITASARAVETGLFNVSLQISDSQIMSMGDNAAGVPGPSEALKGLVKMQNFSSAPRLLLRDGGTVQYAAATDKTTGEVVKVDVTLNVIK